MVFKLDLTDPAKMVAFLRETMKSGLVPEETIRAIIIDSYKKEMREKAEKVRQKGQEPTVNDLTGEQEPEFLKLCEELGLDMEFFEGLALEQLERS